MKAAKGRRITVAPELLGRKRLFVSRTLPRMLRQCIGLDRVRSGIGGNSLCNLSGTTGLFSARLKEYLWDDFFVFSKKERMYKKWKKQ